MVTQARAYTSATTARRTLTPRTTKRDPALASD